MNRRDVILRQRGCGLELPKILGMDGAGMRCDTGEEVVIYPCLNWGDNRAGPGSHFAIVGDATDGTYAELVAVPESVLYPKPPKLSWEEAAALPCAALTAYRALFTRARVMAGETVLVLGAGGDVSTFAVMFAAAADAEVYVTSSSPSKIRAVQKIGAKGGVLHTDPDWPQQVRELTSGGADVIISGSGSMVTGALDCVKVGGRIAVFGPCGGRMAMINVPALFLGQVSILGSNLGSPDDFGEMLVFVRRNDIRPVIDRVYPLSEISRAHSYFESQVRVGKVVVTTPA